MRRPSARPGGGESLFQEQNCTAGEPGITGIKLSDAMAGEPARGWIHKTAEEQAERVRLIDQDGVGRVEEEDPGIGRLTTYPLALALLLGLYRLDQPLPLQVVHVPPAGPAFPVSALPFE